jgi:hypothetical protein
MCHASTFRHHRIQTCGGRQKWADGFRWDVIQSTSEGHHSGPPALVALAVVTAQSRRLDGPWSQPSLPTYNALALPASGHAHALCDFSGFATKRDGAGDPGAEVS